MKQAELNKASFLERVASLGGALDSVRTEAAKRVSNSGLPTTRHEDWKYTNLSPAILVGNAWLDGAQASQADTDIASKAEAAIDANWIRALNGHADLTSLNLPAGITVRALSAEASFPTIDEPLDQLNAALLVDGIEIIVDDGTEVDVPVGLLFADDATGGELMTQNRVHITVGRNARLQVVEAHSSAGDNDAWSNCVTHVQLAEGAQLAYLRLQERERHHAQTNALSARLERDARFDHCGFDLGGSLTRNSLDIELAGTGSDAELHGLYLAGAGQHIDNHTRVVHAVGPTRSLEEYRGILNRRSRAVFNGKAVVKEGADGTNADQANHNLLLSDAAEIDTKPELEIYADDVKCSHGATVGQLDDSALFYLRSRGIGPDEATQLLMRAFAARVISDVPVPNAQDYVTGVVDDRLDQLIDD